MDFCDDSCALTYLEKHQMDVTQSSFDNVLWTQKWLSEPKEQDFKCP